MRETLVNERGEVISNLRAILLLAMLANFQLQFLLHFLAFMIVYFSYAYQHISKK